MVYQVAQAVKIPVVGIGGIASAEDVAEFLLCGATAVEVGTATFWDPRRPARLVEEFGRFLNREGVGSAAELRGGLRFEGDS